MLPSILYLIQDTHLNRSGSLTARPTSRAGTKVGLSDPVVPHGRAIAQRIKATPRITVYRSLFVCYLFRLLDNSARNLDSNSMVV
ncbi:hypothetical protein B8W99_19625 [Peribacillus simplex]|nr:hypothetical protein B8W99_19625 [Peribacillus simplex]